MTTPAFKCGHFNSTAFNTDCVVDELFQSNAMFRDQYRRAVPVQKFSRKYRVTGTLERSRSQFCLVNGLILHDNFASHELTGMISHSIQEEHGLDGRLFGYLATDVATLGDPFRVTTAEVRVVGRQVVVKMKETKEFLAAVDSLHALRQAQGKN